MVAKWLDESASVIVASDLTILEAFRGVARQEAAGAPTEDIRRLREQLVHIANSWWLIPIDLPVIHRAAEPFRVEPLRSLDAIHLATALLADRKPPVNEPIVMLCLDKRLRIAAEMELLRVWPLITQEEEAEGEDVVEALRRRRPQP